MTRYDSLVTYLGKKPKYEYDLAFLASAIDKLGSVDSKYRNTQKLTSTILFRKTVKLTATNSKITISTGLGRA